MLKKGLFILLSIVTIGFSTFNNTDNKADIKYQNIKLLSSKENIEIEENSDGINYNVELNKPGDYCSFNVDLVNNNNQDVRIINISNDNLTDDQKKYLDYQITYDNGEEIKINDIIKANSKRILTVTISFKEDLNAEDLPVKDELVDLSFDVNIMPTD